MTERRVRMDPSTFDHWVAAVGDRRTAVRLLGSALLGGVLPRFMSQPVRATQIVVGPPTEGMILTCADAGLTDCGGVCVDAVSDGDNCGGCGVVCGPGSSCASGMCLLTAPPAGVSLVDCAAQGLTGCGWFCTDLAVDAANCGACGNSCALGGYCQGGSCTGVACPDGLTDCGVGHCVDLNSDPNFCGGCHYGCFEGYSCVNGSCV
jgi:hypothetical protein